MGLLNYFPTGFTPKPEQISSLELLEDALSSDEKFIIIQAPTGTGKTFVAKTLANTTPIASEKYCDYVDKYLHYDSDYTGFFFSQPKHGCYILTTTKQLQNQYANTFDDVQILKGKSNYQCMVDEEFSVDFAPCVISSKIKKECFNCHKCLYYNAYREALKNKISVLNYAVFLNMEPHIQRRKMLICDEASELEEELVSKFSVKINYKTLSYIGVEDYKPCRTEDFADVLPWLNDILFSVQSLIDASLSSKFKNNSPAEIKKQKIRMELVESINSVISNSESTRYIVETQKDGVTIVPYRVDKLSQYIFDTTEKVILMSATIPDVKTYAKTLGIKSYKFINIKSTFPPENSPIYCYTKYPLNYANLDKNLPRVVEMAKKLAKHHSDTKGIIHTHTFKITQAFKNVVDGDSRFLFREEGVFNEDIVQMHSLSKASTVLVSPSLAFGLDLKEDLGRWQIIMKIPYFPLNNKRIKLLAEEDPDWYNMKVLVTFIQACGRCTRSKEDHSVTYILDGMCNSFIKKNAHLMEDYFIKRIH